MATLLNLHRLFSRLSAGLDVLPIKKSVSLFWISTMSTTREHRTRGTSPDFNPSNQKLIYPAASRNQGPILQVWQYQIPKYFPADSKLFCLEVASGSGQHVAHFAPRFPNITFQPSDCCPEVMTSIGIYADECPTKNIKKPIMLDIMDGFGAHGFEENSIDIVYCCNMLQVSPYECAISLFANAGIYLKSKGIMITYGPYAFNGALSPTTNVEFDDNLRARDHRWGIRCLTKLKVVAKEHNLSFQHMFDLPANNKCVIWLKD